MLKPKTTRSFHTQLTRQTVDYSMSPPVLQTTSPISTCSMLEFGNKINVLATTTLEMSSPNFFQLSSSALKALKSRPETIEIRWKPRATSHHMIVSEAYPKYVGIAFFTVVKEHFPPINHIGNVAVRPPIRVITLIGEDDDAIRRVLRWARSCCDGKGLVPFPFAQKENRLALSYLDHRAATLLGCVWLAEKINEHITSIVERFIHPADAGLLLRHLPTTDVVFQKLVNYIARVTWHDMQKRRVESHAGGASVKPVPRQRLHSDGFVPLRKQHADTLGGAVDKIINAYIAAARSKRNITMPLSRPAPQPRSSISRSKSKPMISVGIDQSVPCPKTLTTTSKVAAQSPTSAGPANNERSKKEDIVSRATEPIRWTFVRDSSNWPDEMIEQNSLSGETSNQAAEQLSISSRQTPEITSTSTTSIWPSTAPCTKQPCQSHQANHPHSSNRVKIRPLLSGRSAPKKKWQPLSLTHVSDTTSKLSISKSSTTVPRTVNTGPILGDHDEPSLNTTKFSGTKSRAMRQAKIITNTAPENKHEKPPSKSGTIANNNRFTLLEEASDTDF